jgi:lysyl-tRNA synthetase class 2
MLEWYCARAGYRELMDETEQLVREVASMHRGGQLWADGADVDVSQPFARMTVAEAFERYAGVNRAEMLDMAARDEERFFRLMVERIEPALRERAAPVFLVDYPASQASLARSKPEDPSSCERFELYLGDVELCNGFGELCDAVEQRARLERDQRRRAELGKPVYPIDEKFLSDMAQGMPPCAGNALGLDRLVAAAAGVDAIGEVMAFPTDRV